MDRAKERLDTWDRARLQREGYALFGLRGMRDGMLQRDAVIRVLKPRVGGFDVDVDADADASGAASPLRRGFAMGAELPFHRFAQGDMVSLTEGDDHDETGASSVQGVVVERAMHFLKIAVNEDDERKVLDARRLRLDLSANTISHDRAVSALMAFSEAGGMPGYDETSAGRRLSSTAYAPLQRAMIGIPDGGGDLESVARVSPPWAGKGEDAKMRAALSASSTDRLNPSQRAAVRRAMGRTLSIWQGPPGTGKTRTLMSFVEAAVALAGAHGARRGASAGPTVLACAASNVAVDNIVEGLLDAERRGGGDLRVVRLGSPAKVQPWLVSATLGAQVAETAQGKRAAAMRARARGDYTPRGAAARRAAFALEQVAASLVLARADVVCCTCVGAGDELLEGFTFRVACVDEATQCPEPAALIPLTKALSGVLVGDARQLPPTVVSQAAQRAGLGVSLFERLERLGLSPDLLDRQYRMHPSLAAFPSEAFYGGRVASDPDPASRPAPLGFDWPDARCPLVFVEVDGGEERRAPDGLSVFNEREARAAVAAVERLLAAAPNPRDRHQTRTDIRREKRTACRMKPIVVGGRASVRCPGDVGVIAPYAAQVRRVQELWTESKRRRGERDDGEENGVAEDGDGSSSDPAKAAAAAEARAARELEVHSVDGFQGREKEVIVLCTVRANDAKKLGFVADDRRLNVAMTRAKRGLVVLGNRKTLESDETWRRWLRWVDQKGVATTASALGLLRGGEEDRRGT